MSVQYSKASSLPEPYDHNAPPAYDAYNAPAQYHHPTMAEYTPSGYHQQLSTTSGPLSLPIVIPQQRPGSKDRGFMAAYAPSLEESGIDQRTFLQFIDDCNTALQGNKYLASVQVAAFGAGFAPSIIAMAVTTAVQYGVGMANKAHVRNKTNTILDRYNEELFRPRGLYCMIMKYEPEAQEEAQPNQQSSLRGLGAWASANSSGSTWARNPISGKTQGAHALPSAVAPLIYMDNRRQHRNYLSAHPSPSPSSSSSSSETSQPQKPTSSKQKVKNAFDSFNDYLDRRARALYAAENSNDILTTPASQPFKNRYLDPNHAATNSGLIGLISGGTINADPEARRRRKQQRIDEEERRVLDEYHDRIERIRSQQGQSGRETERQLRRVEEDYAPRLKVYSDQRRALEGGERHIKKDILYLTIVNMPSDGEMAAASAQLYQGQGCVSMTQC